MAALKLRSTDKAVSAYVAETEVWKVLHAAASVCLDFEELLALGNAAFDAVSRWDIIWHQKVNSQEIPYDVDDEQRLVALYKLWLVPAEYMLGEVERFQRAGHVFAGADDFRRRCAEVRGILTPDDEFFGPELIPLQEEARAAHRRGETEEFDELGA